MILSWRPIYAYLVSKKYPECVSETNIRVIRRKAAKLTISVEGELLYFDIFGNDMYVCVQ